MAKNKVRFLAGDEGQEYLLKQGKHYIGDYTATTRVKVFPGQEILIYRFVGTEGEIDILTVCKVVEFGLDAKDGVTVKLLDLKTAEVSILNHVPRPFAGYDVYACVPQRVEVERSLKKVNNKGVVESVAAAILVIHKDDPRGRPTEQDNVADSRAALQYLGAGVVQRAIRKKEENR